MKCAKLASEYAQAKVYLKDLGDGKFSAGLTWKDIGYNCQFELGKTAKITGDTDGKEMTALHNFKDGLWTGMLRILLHHLARFKKRFGSFSFEQNYFSHILTICDYDEI